MNQRGISKKQQLLKKGSLTLRLTYLTVVRFNQKIGLVKRYSNMNSPHNKLAKKIFSILFSKKMKRFKLGGRSGRQNHQVASFLKSRKKKTTRQACHSRGKSETNSNQCLSCQKWGNVCMKTCLIYFFHNQSKLQFWIRNQTIRQ